MTTYYRSDDSTYERARAEVDALNGWPDAGTQTSIEPAATAPRDAQGSVLLACSDWLVQRTGTALAGLERIDEAAYLPVPSYPTDANGAA